MSVALVIALAASAAEPQTVATEARCKSYREDTFCSGPGVVWCGQADVLEADQLAKNAAPILWFSPDEPLLPRPTGASAPSQQGWRRKVSLPQALRVIDPKIQPILTDPEDESATAVVYWRITGLLTRRNQQPAVEAAFKQGKLLITAIQTLTLAYFFYYERDEGLEPHYNDTEGIEIQINFEASRDRRHAAITRVTGFAHGSELLSNILQVAKSVRHPTGAPDVTLPITILVEEGKHASTPDRNGDGTYTPGYDVNIKTADAWGVRDVFGSGVIASRFQESFAKPRNPRDRIGPDPTWFGADGPVEAPAECYATPGGLYLPEQGYKIESAPECVDDALPFCADLVRLRQLRPKRKNKQFYSADCVGGRVETIQSAQTKGPVVGAPVSTCVFLNMAYSQQAFVKYDMTGFRMKYLYGQYWPLQPLRFLAPAVRMEGNDFGPQITGYVPFGLPKLGGWFAGRAALIRDSGEWHWRLDVSHTPSLARLADWYGAVGYDWGLIESDQPTKRVGRWALEGGVQVRFRSLWLRVGMRGSLSGGHLSHPRIVSEFGIGPNPKDARVH